MVNVDSRPFCLKMVTLISSPMHKINPDVFPRTKRAGGTDRVLWKVNGLLL